jgi:PleD family two-component response regulator
LSSKHERIVIVEQDAAAQQRLVELLLSAGYEALACETQQDGFKTAQTGDIDLFLLSADLSDLQCCNALAEIKGLEKTAGTRTRYRSFLRSSIGSQAPPRLSGHMSGRKKRNAPWI